MFIKNSATLTLLILSLFTIALFSAATLATQLILGYTPFQELGPQNDPIVINSPCTHIYFIEKYSDGKKARIAVSFICVFITLITTILVLLGVIIFICGCGEKSTQSQQTDIEVPGINRTHNEVFIQVKYPSFCQIGSLFVLATIIIMASIIPFAIYLQALVQANNSICPLIIQSSKVRAITVLMGMMLFFALIAMLSVLVMSCKLQYKTDKMERQNLSESFRHQMRKIIEEIPDTERKFYALKQQEDYQSSKGGNKQSYIIPSQLKSIPSGSHPQDIKLQNMQRVQSIVYQYNPVLRLQSIIAQDN